MRIAAVQLDSAWENRPHNHARARELLDRAEIQPGTLVALPEMFDVGFSMDTSKTDPGENSASEAFCREIARDREVCLIAGVVARAGAGKAANEAVVFSPQGELITRYRKMQPFTPTQEHLNYPAGEKHVTFEFAGCRIAPFICYDLRFPELFRPAAKEGAELFVVIANWPQRRSEHWVRLLQARAIENQAFVLGVNRCGNDPGFPYDGRSSFFDPQGVEIFQADSREQVLTAEFDPAAARAWREQFPALRDMRFHH